jgi:diguanylate cyclase (GGDEF)-like protein/PAS domain S-box-containing protein
MAAQLQVILDNAPAGIVITRNDRLEVLGRQACQMLGHAAQDLQGQSARRIFASDADYAGLGERVRAAFAAHGGFDGDVCFLRQDGSPIWARVHGHGMGTRQEQDGALWILQDMTAAHEARQQDGWISTHDPLTELANRRGFEQRLQLLLAGPCAPGAMGADGAGRACAGVVLFIDIDHFTVVNDVAGHDAGDDVLRHIAHLLQAHVHQAGWVARLGGDEFAVVLPGCSGAHGHVVAEQLRAQVQAWEPVYQGRSFNLGLSIGLVVLEPGLHDVAGVLYAADMACYDAKRAGRNRVVGWQV